MGKPDDDLTSSSASEPKAARTPPTAVSIFDELEALLEAGAPRSELIFELGTKHPELRSIPIPRAIWELAEEIASRSDVIGIESHTLEDLLRLVLFLDRQERDP